MKLKLSCLNMNFDWEQIDPTLSEANIKKSECQKAIRQIQLSDSQYCLDHNGNTVECKYAEEELYHQLLWAESNIAHIKLKQSQ